MQVDFNRIGSIIREKGYRRLGSGSARVVFDMNNGYVVKVAKNRKGVEQNRAEYKIASMEYTKIFAKIIAVSEDFIYLIMEKAEKVKSFSFVLRYYNVRNNHELFRLNEFRDFSKKYNLMIPDLYRRSNWGVVKGRPVIVDYGYTKELRKYYMGFRL